MLLLAAKSGDARALLTLAVREHYGLAALPAIARAPLGKPYFPDCPHIRFSLSHSGDYVLCGVGERDVGVDIETVKPRSSALPCRVLTGMEYRWYEEHGGDWLAFYTLWTRKESLCKRQGRGVVRPRGICPPLPGETPELRSFSGPDWVASVCSDEEICPIRWA